MNSDFPNLYVNQQANTAWVCLNDAVIPRKAKLVGSFNPSERYKSVGLIIPNLRRKTHVPQQQQISNWCINPPACMQLYRQKVLIDVALHISSRSIC